MTMHRPSPERRWVLWIPLILVGLPLTWGWVKREISRLYLALAFEKSLQRDLAQAVELTQTALRWENDDFGLRTLRVSWLIESHRFEEAVSEAEYVLKMVKPEYDLEANAATIQRYILALNNAAYARALAKKGLRRAKEQIDEALLLPMPIDEMARASYLDTRGYIATLLRDYSAARSDLDLAVRLVDGAFGLYLSAIRRQGQLDLDPRLAAHHERNLREGVGLIYRHRALLHRRMGREDLALRDLRRAREIDGLEQEREQSTPEAPSNRGDSTGRVPSPQRSLLSAMAHHL